MTRTSSTLHSSHHTLTMSLSAPGAAAPAGVGIVGSALAAIAARRARRSTAVRG